MGNKPLIDKAEDIKQENTFCCLMRGELTKIFLLVMLVAYPLFMVHGYKDLVYKKWNLFLYASLIFILLSFIVNIFIKVKEFGSGIKKNISYLDVIVLIYLCSVLISFAGAVDRRAAFWGVDTWYMGLVSQLLFVFTYFAISRGYVKLGYLKYLCAGTYIIACGLVLLQRFRIDAFSLYEGMTEEVKLNFVSTMGQVTWTSSYISIMLIAGMGMFFILKDRRRKIFWGSCIFVGFATIAVLNCDSAVIAVACVMLLLLWLSLGNQQRVKELIRIIMIALSAVGIIGILEKIFSARLIPIDGIYIKAAGSPLIYVLLLLAAVIYILLDKGIVHISEEAGRKRIARIVYISVMAVGVIGVIILFVLHGRGYFAGSSTENYFRFTVWWGNSRGFIWRAGAAVFADFNIGRKLFGCGPDGFTTYAYQLMGDSINAFWHNQIVPNAHNEWFNAVINYGLIGGIAYLGIFVTSAKRFLTAGIGKIAEEPEIFGIGLAAVGYIAHNFLCYQQLIGTPLIIILLGLGEALIRSRTKSPADSHAEARSLQ